MSIIFWRNTCICLIIVLSIRALFVPFAGINFRESQILKNFAGINFRELKFSGVKKGIYFREFGHEIFFPRKFVVSTRKYFLHSNSCSNQEFCSKITQKCHFFWESGNREKSENSSKRSKNSFQMICNPSNILSGKISSLYISFWQSYISFDFVGVWP